LAAAGQRGGAVRGSCRPGVAACVGSVTHSPDSPLFELRAASSRLARLLGGT